MHVQSDPPNGPLETASLAHSHLILKCLNTLSYSSGDLRAYLTEVGLSVSQLSQADWTIVTLYDGETGQVVASNLDMRQDDTRFSIHGSLAGEVIQSQRLLIIEDSRQSIRHQLPQEYCSYLGIPLKTLSREVIGTICSFFRQPRLFVESEVKIVELFAERAATVIENYRLYQQQQQFNTRLSQEVATCSINLQQSQEKLIERERLAAIGEFTAMIMHEVRNPLTTIQMGLSHARKVLPSDADQQRLGLALSEVHRLKHLLCEILSYAKPQVLQCARLNLSEFFNELLSQISDLPEAAERQIMDDTQYPGLEVMADKDKLKQVFLNLLRNACEATSPGDSITCKLTTKQPSSQVCIQIHNGGDPIPPELLQRLTEPFYSTKSTGTGLGLAISKRIIIAHGGKLEITSSNIGTTVRVYLPLID